MSKKIYVECTSKGPCSTSTSITNPYKCTSAMWVVDPVNKVVTDRLVSPYLSGLYGGSFGVQGKPIGSPEKSLILASNAVNGVLAVVRPSSTGLHDITELVIVNTHPNCVPDTIVFYSKFPNVEFGSDPDPSNYWAVIALQGKDPVCGMVFLDMATAISALNAKNKLLSSTSVKYLSVGSGGGSNRVLIRGGTFLVTPIWTYSASTISDPYDGFALVSTITQSVIRTFSLSGVVRLSYVPIIPGELISKVNELQASVNALSASLHSHDAHEVVPAEQYLEKEHTRFQAERALSSSTDNANKVDANKATAALYLSIISCFISLVCMVLTMMIYCTHQSKQIDANDNSNDSYLATVH